ncbi:hypothetical protein ACLOJK_034925, partial [Asimina triloba]
MPSMGAVLMIKGAAGDRMGCCTACPSSVAVVGADGFPCRTSRSVDVAYQVERAAGEASILAWPTLPGCVSMAARVSRFGTHGCFALA